MPSRPEVNGNVAVTSKVSCLPRTTMQGFGFDRQIFNHIDLITPFIGFEQPRNNVMQPT